MTGDDPSPVWATAPAVATVMAIALLVVACAGAPPPAESATGPSVDFGETDSDPGSSNGTIDTTEVAVSTIDDGGAVGEPTAAEPAVDEAIAAVVDEWYRVWSECIQEPAGCDVDGRFDGVVADRSPFLELTVEMITIRRETGLVARLVDERDVDPDISILSVETAPDGSGIEAVTCVRDRFADFIESGGESTLIDGSDEPVVRRERIRLRADDRGDWRVWDVRSIDEGPVGDDDGSCESPS